MAMPDESRKSGSEVKLNFIEIILSDLCEALMETPESEKCLIASLKSMSPEAKKEYLNIKRDFIKKPTKAPSFLSFSIFQKVHGFTLVWDDLMNKRQGEERFMPRKTIVAEFINSRGNNINVADLVCRISREAIKEYLNLTTVYTSETEVNTQDCDPTASRQKASTQAASESLSSTAKKSKKSKATFGDICEYFIPCPVLPGGLVLAQSIYCAEVALSFFNCKHGMNYKLIEPPASAQYMVCGVRFHSNFIAAKLEKNARTKLFYANFRCSNKRVRDVHCCIVNFNKTTFACCGECPPVLAHCEKRYTEGQSVNSCTYSSKESKARKNEFCAKAALNFFNEKHGTKYGLVEPLDSFIVPINLGTYRFDCRFKAKLEEPGDADDDASSPKLFAAELVMSTGWKDGYCYIINTAEDLDDDQRSCFRQQGTVQSYC